MSAADDFARAKLCSALTGDDWLAIQNAVSNDGDLEQLKRMELVEALGELASLAPIPASDDDEIECGQCEGTGETDAMGFNEPCPVCDGSGRIARDDD